jgi:hypothetical protein
LYFGSRFAWNNHERATSSAKWNENLNGGLHGFYEKQEIERQEVEESTVEESPEFDNPRYPHGLDPGISAPLHRNRIVPVERAA